MKPKVMFKKLFSLLLHQTLLFHPFPDLLIYLVSTLGKDGLGPCETPGSMVAHIDIWLMLHISCISVVFERRVKINEASFLNTAFEIDSINLLTGTFISISKKYYLCSYFSSFHCITKVTVNLML